MMLGINHNGFWLKEDVVDRNSDGQKPSQDGQHLVGDDTLPAVGFPLREGVYYRWSAQPLVLARGNGNTNRSEGDP